MYFRQITEPGLAHNAYLIGCKESGEAIIIDPQRDTDRYEQTALEEGLIIVAAAETHIHSDYLSGLRQFAEKPGVRIFVSDEGDRDRKYQWLQDEQYDRRLLKDGDVFRIGSVRFDILHTPGHSPEHICFSVTDEACGATEPVGILTGDFVFIGDVGRPDFPVVAEDGGKADPPATAHLESLQRFRKLPPYLQVWPGHGAGSVCGKSIGSMPISTVGYELAFNRSILASDSPDDFMNHVISGQLESPYYFARMKTENRRGPAVLENLPSPEALSPDRFRELIESGETVLVDTREWQDFRERHIPGSIFAPLSKSFSTVTGSYIEADRDICLIVRDNQLSDAISGLIRVGLDNITGFVTPNILAEYFSAGGRSVRTEEIDVFELNRRMKEGDVLVLDVRRAFELLEFGKLPGSGNIAHTRLLPERDKLPRDREIYVHCRSGIRSTYSCGYLQAQGFRVVHVAGGFLAWEEAKFEVVPGSQPDRPF